MSGVAISIKVTDGLFTASNRFTKRVKEASSKLKNALKKLLQAKIFQNYCWPTDTIPYLMGL